MARRLPLIEVGYPVFLADGADSFGAVRRLDLSASAPTLVVDIEGAGDFRIPLDAVEKVAAKKVLVRWDLLDPEVRRAIEHTTEAEDFPPPGGEAEIVGRGPDDSEETLPARYAIAEPSSPEASGVPSMPRHRE